jgi:hypothetical protein
MNPRLLSSDAGSGDVISIVRGALVSMVTHRFPLGSVVEAIETVTNREAIKVAVLPGWLSRPPGRFKLAGTDAEAAFRSGRGRALAARALRDRSQVRSPMHMGRLDRLIEEGGDGSGGDRVGDQGVDEAGSGGPHDGLRLVDADGDPDDVWYASELVR